MENATNARAATTELETAAVEQENRDVAVVEQEKEVRYLVDDFCILLYNQIRDTFSGKKSKRQDYKILPLLISTLSNLLSNQDYS